MSADVTAYVALKIAEAMDQGATTGELFALLPDETLQTVIYALGEAKAWNVVIEDGAMQVEIVERILRRELGTR